MSDKNRLVALVFDKASSNIDTERLGSLATYAHDVFSQIMEKSGAKLVEFFTADFCPTNAYYLKGELDEMVAVAQHGAALAEWRLPIVDEKREIPTLYFPAPR